MYILFLKKLKKWFLFNYYNFSVKELCKAIILVVIDKLGQIHELLFYYGEYIMNHNISYQYENIKLQPIKKMILSICENGEMKKRIIYIYVK